MANLKKFTRMQTPQIINHVARAPNDDCDRENQEIDPTRTHLNHDLVSGDYAGDVRDPHAQLVRLAEILDRVEIRVNPKSRPDLKVAACWTIQCPPEVPSDREEEFFAVAYSFLQDQYGKDNVVSAWIHHDETRPHMHYLFVPIVETMNEQTHMLTERLCASECITRNSLKQFHPKLQKYVDQAMGMHVSIMNGATASGNKTITELKLQSLQQELAAKKAQLAIETEKESVFRELLNTLAVIRRKFAELEAYLQKKKWFGEEKEKLRTLTEQYDALNEMICQAQSAASTVIKSANQFEEEFRREIGNGRRDAMKEYMNKKAEAESLNRKLQKRMQQLDREIHDQVLMKLEKEILPVRLREEQLNRKEMKAKCLDREITAKTVELQELEAEKEEAQKEILKVKETINDLYVQAQRDIEKAVEVRLQQALQDSEFYNSAMRLSNDFIRRYHLCIGNGFPIGGEIYGFGIDSIEYGHDHHEIM